MIKKWRLSNFKSIKKATELEFAPLTILTGANSSGKSSLIQSILMVAQTLKHKLDSRSVVLNGAFLNLGQFCGIKSYGSKIDKIDIGFWLEPRREINDREEYMSHTYYKNTYYERFCEEVQQSTHGILRIESDFTIDVNYLHEELDNLEQVRQLRPNLYKSDLTVYSDTFGKICGVSVRILRNEDYQKRVEESRKLVELDSFFEGALRYSIRLSGDSPDLEYDTEKEIIGCATRHFLPWALLRGEKVEDRYEYSGIERGSSFFSAVHYSQLFFSNSFKYLGPLRETPKPLYPFAVQENPLDLGLRGEHTAAVLDLFRDERIQYIPSSHFEEPVINKAMMEATLFDAVKDWLQYLGVATDVVSKNQGKLGHGLQVELQNSKHLHDLTHVGVGVSQVLPILVMCLLAEFDSTLVFEQPELHLHPKVQTRLGDFFFSMALIHKQCIVETHSEYLINRLRFRIAASEDDTFAEQVKIYFVEKDLEGSKFRELVIHEYGAIVNWPKGFFDESQEQAEKILTAAMKKKQEEKRKN